MAEQRPKLARTVIDPSVRLREAGIGRCCEILRDSQIEYATLGDYSYLGEDCMVSDAAIGRFCAIAARVPHSPAPTTTTCSGPPVLSLMPRPSHRARWGSRDLHPAQLLGAAGEGDVEAVPPARLGDDAVGVHDEGGVPLQALSLIHI